MTPRSVALGLTGLAASALVHASAFWALAAMVAPERAPDQPTPEARLDIAAQNVPRGDATAMTPEAQALSQSEGDTNALRQGNLTRTKAEALAPSADRLPGVTGHAQTLQPAEADLQPTTQPPRPKAMAALTPTDQPLAAAQLSSQSLGITTTTALRLPRAELSVAALAADVPYQPAQAASQPQAQPATLADPLGDAVTSALPQSTQAPAQPLPEEFQTAALAWSGDAENTSPLSAASLAAIAAFMRPEDVGSGARELRDGIAGILASVPCARLQTEFDPEAGALVLRGHIPEDGLRAPVLAALRTQIGASIPLQDKLLILPRPQCAALAGIAGIGLPQSTEQLTNPRVIGDEGFARTYTYANGDRLELELQAPDYPSFVYVDYFTADGSVLHLQPNQIVSLPFAAPKSALSVGKPTADGAFLDLTIGPPFGQEIAVAFAASAPLYDRLRPLQEPADPYLAWLRDRVAAKRSEDPSFKGEWVYFFVSTVPE